MRQGPLFALYDEPLVLAGGQDLHLACSTVFRATAIGWGHSSSQSEMDIAIQHHGKSSALSLKMLCSGVESTTPISEEAPGITTCTYPYLVGTGNTPISIVLAENPLLLEIKLHLVEGFPHVNCLPSRTLRLAFLCLL